MDDKTRLRRWRLILGSESQKRFDGMGGEGLSGELDMMDQALAAIYNKTDSGGFGSAVGRRGQGPTTVEIARWLGDVRSLFDKELVSVIQGDAMERCGLKQLIFEPELLDQVEPDMNLACSILALKDQIPKRSKESVRVFIRKIVEEINKLLEQDIRRAVSAAVNRRQHSPIPSAAALDYKSTISRNLKNYNPQLGTIVPEHFYFFDRTSTTAANKWSVILDIDRSGSMYDSIIYSSVMSCILASMSSLKTRVVSFAGDFTDLTDLCADPVDLLFGFELGGGTDINKSVAYCQNFMEDPARTLFFLVTDLEECGNRAALVRRLDEVKQSGVTVVCLLAISDGGKPRCDEQMAQKVAGLGIPCFACQPQMLPLLLERALKGQDLNAFRRELSNRST